MLTGMFTFDEETHTYRLGGEILPSVTQIIKPLYDFSSVPAGVLERAAAFGTAVHKTVELYLKDDLDESNLDEGLSGPLQAFRMWAIEYLDAFGSPEVETRDYHEKLFYAGTSDLKFERVLVDVKTRAVNRLCDPIQLAAYDHFDSGKRARYVLELKQDGTYVFTHLNPTLKSSNESWSRFRYLLDYHNAGKKLKEWRNAA